MRRFWKKAAKQEEFKETVEALSRVLNIATKGKDLDINPEIFENNEEKTLFNRYVKANERITALSIERKEEDVFQVLSSLKEDINSYFDHTMIMADHSEVKANRLAQMVKLSNLIQHFAKFNVMVVK